MSAQQIIRIDELKWWVATLSGVRQDPQPLCPNHDLRLTPITKRLTIGPGKYRTQLEFEATELECAEGPHTLKLPRPFGKERQYVINRVDAKVFKNMPILNLDDEAIPIAKEKVKSKDDKYFVTTQLMESKRGLQVVIYAGEKGRPQKTQLFVEPGIKRIAFDQKDLNPSEVFVEIKATFNDGSSHTIERGK